MDTKDYIVEKIEGEYAYLKDTENPSAEPLFIALFLLPMGTDIGTKLHYEMMQFEIAE